MESMDSVSWQRSSFCGTTTCVEVARVGGEILVRDSKNPQMRPLSFDEAEWAAFTQGVKAGEFRF